MNGFATRFFTGAGLTESARSIGCRDDLNLFLGCTMHGERPLSPYADLFQRRRAALGRIFWLSAVPREHCSAPRPPRACNQAQFFVAGKVIELVRRHAVEWSAPQSGLSGKQRQADTGVHLQALPARV